MYFVFVVFLSETKYDTTFIMPNGVNSPVRTLFTLLYVHQQDIQMYIDKNVCINCSTCIPFCPVEAIEETAGDVSINRDICVECGVCYRLHICPADAVVTEKLTWPRVVRAVFSDPSVEHKATGIAGRGIEEVKTNDVTKQYVGDMINVAIELGRPGRGTSFHDVELFTRMFARHNIFLRPENPVFHIQQNPKTGELKKEILEERALSVIIDFTFSYHQLAPVFTDILCLKDAVSTLFSLSVAGEVTEDGAMVCTDIFHSLNLQPAEHIKLNIGIGKEK
jgi:ferredoxin